MRDLSRQSGPGTIVSSSGPEVEILPPAPHRSERETIVIQKHRGFMGTLALGVSVSVVLLVGGWMVSRWQASDWLKPYLQSWHADDSKINALHRDNLKGLRAGEVELVLAGSDGSTLRVAAPKREVENFEREMLFFLKGRQDAATADFHRAVGAAFDRAFADSDQALEGYADWFFEWKRSWILLKEAVAGGASELTNLLSPSKIWEGATARVRGYLMENYQSRVLQPDLRQPVLQRELETAFQASHARFRGVVEELGSREAAFVRERTRLLERYEPGSVTIALDWGAQKWKIPAHMAEDRAEDAYRSVAVMGTAVALTPLLMPVIRTAAEGIFEIVAVRIVSENTGAILGAYLGFETWGVSLALGAGADYLINRVDEKLNRDNFIRDHKAALRETRTGWEQLARDQLTAVVASWYGDTQQAVMMSNSRPAGANL
jgi:hypothetical protein